MWLTYFMHAHTNPFLCVRSTSTHCLCYPFDGSPLPSPPLPHRASVKMSPSTSSLTTPCCWNWPNKTSCSTIPFKVLSMHKLMDNVLWSHSTPWCVCAVVHCRHLDYCVSMVIHFVAIQSYSRSTGGDTAAVAVPRKGHSQITPLVREAKNCVVYSLFTWQVMLEQPELTRPLSRTCPKSEPTLL